MKAIVSRRILSGGLMAMAAMVVLGGCAVAPTSPTVMVLPGTQKSPGQFQADASACQLEAQNVVAPLAQAANNQAASNVVIGTVVGAAAGALLGQGSYNPGAVAAWGAGTGMLVGSAAAGGNSQVSSYSLQQQFNFAYMQCMYQRGHQVPGQPAYRSQPAGVAPPPPPPNYRPQAAPAQGYPPSSYSAPMYPPPNTPPPVAARPRYGAPVAPN